MTGCNACDKKQLETGDKGVMCLICEIGLCEQTISSAMDRIEQLQNLLRKENNGKPTSATTVGL